MFNNWWIAPQFANLYAWYSWPNVLLPIVGGYLMDSVFGIRIGTIIFAMFIILGQALFACGAFLSNYPLMQG
jgi:dipeptide/tripeptide permease